MPTSPREAIMDALVTALRTIGTTGSFSATVTPTVMRARHPALTVPQYPFIYVGAEREDYGDGRHGNFGAAAKYLKTLGVGIAYWFIAGDMDQAVSAAVHDVEYALREWTIGGAATDLQILSNEAFVSDTDEPLCGVRFEVQVAYGISDQSPSTRI